MRSLSLFLALGLSGAACTGSTSTTSGDDVSADEWDQRLNERVLDYSAALRTAALRLTGDLPTLADIQAVATAGDAAAQKPVYEALVRGYLDDPRFARQMLRFWRDTFKLGETAKLDTAPTFAAQLAVENRSYTELLTATTGTCPTFDAGAGTFTAADCGAGVTTAAGVLTNPGVMAHFQSNMAFRRVRWVQEVFACTAFPAEMTGAQPDGRPQYLSPWAMESIAGTDNGGTVDFHDTSAVICANCHATKNHLAPLFANFDDAGQLTGAIAVHTPLPGSPLAKATDWLPPGEPTAWRFGKPTPDLPSLGAAMAADPAIAECAVARLWNWAMGKGDIVDTLAAVPSETIAGHVAAFTASGGKLKDAIFAVYTSDDFVRF